MKKLTKIILYFLIVCAGIIITAMLLYWKQTSIMLHWRKSNSSEKLVITPSDNERLLPKALALKRFAAANDMDTNICFLVDMNIPSGSNRFFVFDWRKNKIIQAGLVAHGRCNETYLQGKRYANTIGGGCTSLGRYKIGNAYNGRFGLAYKLYGLDSSNSHVFERFVVLHAHACVPAEEVAPYTICQSDGCPTVAPEFLQILAGIIENASRPVALEIFDDKWINEH